MKASSIILFATVVLFAPFSGTVRAGGTYSGGTGEPNNPYRIADANDMNDIGNHPEDWGSHFVMVNDINLAEYTGTQYNIIGDDWDHPFTGVFDGNGHTISNLTSDGRSFGLFYYVGDYIHPEINAEIKNLTLIDPNINLGYCGHGGVLVADLMGGTITNCIVEGGKISGGFDSYSIGGLVGKVQEDGSILNSHTTILVPRDEGGGNIGGLVGDVQNGTISNCYATGDIVGFGAIGGLVGFNHGTILNCYATGKVSGLADFGYSIGGLVGSNHGTISTCYANGNVSGNHTVGGLVGTNGDSAITNCYAAGDVSGDSTVGGLVGMNQNASISNCYATGSVDVNDFTGGLVGDNSAGSYNKSFWNNSVNPLLQSFGDGTVDPNVIGKPTEEMKKESTFTNWDFVQVWDIGENQTYPFLRVYPPGDLNHDSMVNFIDVGILADHWLESWD